MRQGFRLPRKRPGTEQNITVKATQTALVALGTATDVALADKVSDVLNDDRIYGRLNKAWVVLTLANIPPE